MALPKTHSHIAAAALPAFPAVLCGSPAWLVSFAPACQSPPRDSHSVGPAKRSQMRHV